MGRIATLMSLDVRQHTGQDLEPEVFFIPEAVGPALDHPDLVVQALDKAEGDLVLREAVSGDSLPMTFDQLGEVFIGLETLPLERGRPVIEEASGPTFSRVVPELTEGLFEQVGRVEALVCLQKGLQGLFPGQRHRFSRWERSVYFWPLMKRRLRPETRAYSLLRTLSKASPKCRMTSNLS